VDRSIPAQVGVSPIPCTADEFSPQPADHLGDSSGISRCRAPVPGRPSWRCFPGGDEQAPLPLRGSAPALLVLAGVRSPQRPRTFVGRVVESLSEASDGGHLRPFQRIGQPPLSIPCSRNASERETKDSRPRLGGCDRPWFNTWTSSGRAPPDRGPGDFRTWLEWHGWSDASKRLESNLPSDRVPARPPPAGPVRPWSRRPGARTTAASLPHGSCAECTGLPPMLGARRGRLALAGLGPDEKRGLAGRSGRNADPA